VTFDTLTVAWTKNLIAFLFDVMIFGVFSEAEQQVGRASRYYYKQRAWESSTQAKKNYLSKILSFIVNWTKV